MIHRMDNVLIVVEDLEAAKAFFAELGMELEGEYEDIYRLCFVRGPEGIIIGLSEQLS